MKLVISNIAWSKSEEAGIADQLSKQGIKYVEVAPTKNWEDPTAVADEDLVAFSQFWRDKGLQIVSFQSMLYNRPDLTIFQDEDNRNDTLEYLKNFIHVAKVMGAKIMVFGSPKNRQRKGTPLREANVIAKDFFGQIAETAHANGVIFCIEPNPIAYDCDFVTTTREGLELVRSVNHPGFGLHLDSAGMTLASDNVGQAIKAAGKELKHFHISAPFLGDVNEKAAVDYQAAAAALHEIGYQGYVSIEMRPAGSGNSQRVSDAVELARKFFGKD